MGLFAVTRDLWPELSRFLNRHLGPVFSRLEGLLSALAKLYLSTSGKLSTARRRTMSHVFWWVADKLTFILFLFWFTLFEILKSTVMDLYSILTTLFHATYTIADYRETAKYRGLKGDEDTWGFGQILPMLLLALPVFQILEIFYGRNLPTSANFPEKLDS